MRRIRVAGLVVVGVATVAGCGSVGPLELDRDGEPLLRTDRTSYTLRPTDRGVEFSLPFTFVNRTGGRVYLVNCHGAYAHRLEKAAGNEWIGAWSPVLPLCLSPPIVIETGDTFADTLHIFGGDPSENVAPEFRVEEIDGLYRLVWSARSSYDPDAQGFGELLPLEQRISNAFELEDPR